eukprot:4815450-Amphidinium_carterae.2
MNGSLYGFGTLSHCSLCKFLVVHTAVVVQVFDGFAPLHFLKLYVHVACVAPCPLVGLAAGPWK